MKKSVLNRSSGIAMIVFLAGIGISGCSSPSNNAAPIETPASQSASPSASPEASSEPTQDAVSSATEVADTVNGFFVAIDMESRAGAERLTADSVTADTIKEVYPGTLSFISKDMNEDKAFEMLALFSSFSTIPGTLTVTVPEEGVVLSGDTATISGEKLVLELDGQVLPKSENAADTSGQFELKRIGDGKWEISGFEMGSAAADAAAAEPAK